MPGAGPSHPGGAEDRPTATGIHVHADLAPGSVVAGRFRVDGLLGVGGMGVVYRATDLTLDIPVALKLLRPELAARQDAFERFRQELLLARQVSSPHVVRIHDLVRHEGLWLIGMDFVDGESLDRRIEREGALPLEDALHIARQLAEGLAAAHAKGVVHRDLKPANVLLDADGNAFISDFGVARSLATSGMTRSGAVVGTPDYLSPEQARGGPVDARSDLYALGLILYEMLSGRQPFPGGTVSETLAQRMMGTPRPINELRADAPAWVVRLLDRLLRPNPAHRFDDARAVANAIQERAVPAEPLPRRLRSALSGGRGAAVAAGLAAVLALGGAWWLQRSGEGASPFASPPLERLLVLPPASHTPGIAPAARVALGARMHAAIDLAPGLATVDRARMMQSVDLLDPTGSARYDVDGLRDIAAARRVLEPRLIRVGNRWRVESTLHVQDAPGQTIEGPPAATPMAAMQAWLATPALADALGVSPGGLPATWPAGATDEDTEQALGTGLQAFADNDLATAIDRLRFAADRAPGDPIVQLALVEAAQAIGELDVAFDALERADAALAPDAPARLQRRIDAELALLEGEPTRATADWRAQLEATPDDTFAELNLARALGAGGDFGAAVDQLQALTARDANDPRAWYELGKFSILSGDARRAVDDHLVRALVLFKRSGNRYGEAETLNALGIGYGRLGQTADAAEQYREAADLRRAVGNRAGVATSLRNLANVQALTGDFADATTNLAEARQIHDALGDRNGLAAVDNELGLLAEEQGDHRAALEAFRRALAGWRGLDDPHGVAQALNNIGFAHYQLGAYDDAQVYWQQAGEAYESLGSATGRIRTRQNLGLLAIARGRWDQAKSELEASLADALAQQMVEEAAVSHRNLAELALWEGRIGDAIDQAQRAEALFLQREDRRGQADAALLRVQAFVAVLAHDRARELLAALEPLLAESSAEQRAIADLQRARIARSEGRIDEAAARLRAADALAGTSGVRALQLQIALERAQLENRAPAAPTVEGIGALGHVGLVLALHEWTMRLALDTGRADRALSDWPDVAGLLRGRPYLHAHRLHAMHAEALSASGDADAATRARAQADDTLAALAATLPEALRAGFDAAHRPILAEAEPSP
ncbi:hypothetical protein GCM10028862_05190 [Luteimonas pelagia]